MARSDGAMAVKDSIPDDELRTSLGVAERPSLGVRYFETGQTFEAVPYLIPLWLVALSLAIPMAATIWVLFFDRARWGIGPEWWPVAVAFLCLAVLVAVVLLAIFSTVNRAEQTKGKIFVLDRNSGTLELPRRKVTLLASQVREIVELRGWALLGDYERFVEIGVLVETEHGLVRHPLVFDTGPRKPAIKAAEQVASFFKVPHRVVERERRDLVKHP